MVQMSCLLVRTKVNWKIISFYTIIENVLKYRVFQHGILPPNEVIIQDGNVELAMGPRYSCLFCAGVQSKE
jgi:hypothetical protein